MGRRRCSVGALLSLFLLSSCDAGTAADPEPRQSKPSLAAQVVQLRRDQALERVEVALQNNGGDGVVVERLLVRIPGFDSGSAIPKRSPVPAGQVVNLPWPYGTVRCGAGGTPSVGRPVVILRVHTDSDPTPRRVRLTARDPGGLLQAIAVRACTVARLAREVDLSFGSGWRPERTPDGVIIHGSLDARLLIDQPRNITQVRGAILYGLRPDEAAGPVRVPLAALTPAAPKASIPIQAFAARCDAHTIGEIKKPYEFLVWIAAPGREPIAVTPAVDSQTKAALRLACAF